MPTKDCRSSVVKEAVHTLWEYNLYKPTQVQNHWGQKRICLYRVWYNWSCRACLSGNLILGVKISKIYHCVWACFDFSLLWPWDTRKGDRFFLQYLLATSSFALFLNDSSWWNIRSSLRSRSLHGQGHWSRSKVNVYFSETLTLSGSEYLTKTWYYIPCRN